MAAEIPSEIAWVMPVIFPFLIGLFSGIIIKRGVKLLLAIVGLAVILAAGGYISLSFKEVYNKAMEVLPRLSGETKGSLENVLPISAPSFLVGLGLGLWFG